MKRKGKCSSFVLMTLGLGMLLTGILGCEKNCCTIGFLVSTDSVYEITGTSAKCGGTIASDDEDTVMARGVCWSINELPTIEDNKTSDSLGVGKFTSLLTGLIPNTGYFVRAYVTNRKGTAYGGQVRFKTGNSPVFTVGTTYGGGIIFYIDSTGVHGFIASVADQSNQVSWGCSGILLAGADGTIIGTGAKNTDTINYGCNEPDIAARICTEYTSGNYSDWYLPSLDELYLLYFNRALLEGLVDSFYWSSTQEDSDFAWVVHCMTGIKTTKNKADLYPVRAIRSF